MFKYIKLLFSLILRYVKHQNIIISVLYQNEILLLIFYPKGTHTYEKWPKCPSVA